MPRDSSIAALVLLLSVAIAAAEPLIEVRSDGGTLRVKAVDAPFGEVLAAVTAETDIHFDVDESLSTQHVTADTEPLPIDRTIAALVAALPSPAGHVMRYAADEAGTERLVAVSIVPERPSAAPSTATTTTPLDARIRKLEAAGVPRETAERAMALAEEARTLREESAAGTFRSDEVPPDLHGRLEQLVEDGVPEDQAARQLLLQRRYQEVLRELSQVPGGPALLLDAATSGRP